MLCLHGAGECGTNLDLLKRNGPPKYVLSHPDFPFILVSPQSKGGWDLHVLIALLDEVVSKYRVDRSQIYLTGLSMGGGGAWNLAAAHPERFAAVVPVSGVGDPAAARKLATLPIWVFHGAKDDLVPLQASQEMVDALREVGNAAKFTIYPDAGHDSWTPTYNNPALFDWFLNQKRQAPSVSHLR